MPLLTLGKQVKPGDLGTGGTFADIAATVAELFGIKLDTPGTSFAGKLF